MESYALKDASFRVLLNTKVISTEISNKLSALRGSSNCTENYHAGEWRTNKIYWRTHSNLLLTIQFLLNEVADTFPTFLSHPISDDLGQLRCLSLLVSFYFIIFFFHLDIRLYSNQFKYFSRKLFEFLLLIIDLRVQFSDMNFREVN